MNTTHTQVLTGAVAAAIATGALLFGAVKAHAFPAIDNPASSRDCSSCVGFIPQPDPPSFPDYGNHASIGNPNDRQAPSTPGSGRVGLGGPDTAPPQQN